MLLHLFLSFVVFEAYGDSCTKYEFIDIDSNKSVCGVFIQEYNIFILDTSLCEGNAKCQNNHTYSYDFTDIMTHKSIYCIQGQPEYQIQGRYPGSKCESNEDCIFKNNKGCQNKSCKGYGEGESFSCNWADHGSCSKYCDPGLFAKESGNYTCVKQYKENEACDATEQCQNNYNCANSTCEKIGSFKNGQKIAIGKGDVNGDYFCQSFFINYTTGVCEDPPRSSNDQAAKCQTSKDCKRSDERYTDCRCGLDGEKHCTLAPGDDYYLKYNQVLKEWYTSEEINECNTIARFSIDCIHDYMDKKLFEKYYYYGTLAKNYQTIKDAEDKLIRVFAPKYYYDPDRSELIRVLYALLGFLLAQ